MAIILFLNPLYYQQEFESVLMLCKCLKLKEKIRYWNDFSSRLLKFKGFINKTSQFYLKRHEIHVKGERKSEVQSSSNLGVCPSSS